MVDDILQILEQYWTQYQNIILAGIGIIVVLLLQRILVRLSKRSASRAQLPPEAANGLILIIRLGTVFVIFTILTSYAGLSSEVLALSTFVGAAIGFASAQTIGNVIAGIYVMITRPFRIGDYVRIGGEEGIVREISLNYTRLLAPDNVYVLVPNRTVINRTVRSYRRVLREEGREEDDTALHKAISFLREAIDEEEIFVYPLEVAIHASYSFETTRKVFDEVCKLYGKSDKFGFPVTYFVSTILSGQTRYKFFISTKDPYQILQLQPEFLRDLLDRLEQTKQ